MANNAPPIPSWQGFRDPNGGLSTSGYSWLQSLGSFANKQAAASATEASAADYQGNAAGFKSLTPETVWESTGYVALTDGTTIAVDMSTGFNFSVSIAGNQTLSNPSNAKPGQSGCFKVTASGADRTISADTNYKKTGDLSFPVTIASGTSAYIFYWTDTSSRILITAVLNNPA